MRKLLYSHSTFNWPKKESIKNNLVWLLCSNIFLSYFSFESFSFNMQLFVISKSTSVDPTPSPDVIDTLKATLHFPFLHNSKFFPFLPYIFQSHSSWKYYGLYYPFWQWTTTTTTATISPTSFYPSRSGINFSQTRKFKITKTGGAIHRLPSPQNHSRNLERKFLLPT